MSNTHWKAIRLDEFCDLVLDCVNKTAPTVEYDTGFKMIRTTNVKDGYVSLHGVRHVTSEVYEKWTRRGRPKSGDVIMTREAPLGEVGLLRDATGVFLGQRLVMYRSNPNTNEPKFLLYALMGQELQSQIKAYGSGSTVEHMRVPDCSALLIKTPPLPTQKKIASILSAYDDLIENNNRRIKILEEMAQNIYREWFVHFRYPGHEDVPLVDSELGQIPQGWEVKKVEDLVNRERPGKLFSQKTVFEQGDVPVLDQGKSGIIGYHDEAPGVLASLDEPIIIFANHTCYQRIIMFPFSAIQNVLPFRPHPQILRNIYWLHWATKDLVTFNDYKGHWPEFMAKSLPVPPTNLSEQFGSIAEQIVRMSFRLGNINQNLRKTRDMLLPKLISGQLDVEELDIIT